MAERINLRKLLNLPNRTECHHCRKMGDNLWNQHHGTLEELKNMIELHYYCIECSYSTYFPIQIIIDYKIIGPARWTED